MYNGQKLTKHFNPSLLKLSLMIGFVKYHILVFHIIYHDYLHSLASHLVKSSLKKHALICIQYP